MRELLFWVRKTIHWQEGLWWMAVIMAVIMEWVDSLLAVYGRWRQRRRWRRMTRGIEAVTAAVVQLGESMESGHQAVQGLAAWWDSLTEAEREEIRRLDELTV